MENLPSNEATPAQVCGICCDQNKHMVALSNCSHMSCKDCLSQWIEKAESTGQEVLPGCPFCRVGLTNEDIIDIMGRPFQPKTTTTNTTALTVELDELTRHYIESHTRPCPACGVYISKEEGTCNKMECLCGFRFCFACGSHGAQCDCSPYGHGFEDNWLETYAERHGTDDWEDRADTERHGRMTDRPGWERIAFSRSRWLQEEQDDSSSCSSSSIASELTDYRNELVVEEDDESQVDDNDDDDNDDDTHEEDSCWEEDDEDMEALIRAIKRSQQIRDRYGRTTAASSFYVPHR